MDTADAVTAEVAADTGVEMGEVGEVEAAVVVEVMEEEAAAAADVERHSRHREYVHLNRVL